ncbi:hypothetical protein JRO89_XS13G0206700 [Xanthoceras sorbifolium]|uniref:UspA domain-containing protein n=1 Tax=Xanthoceras sorbifolium TaxID=99658 RepID=A0ABQ8H9C7_9ROSI|nr:hypothetical protein JRO89_XS13G0206700 [Xanthoceras sorbifolium]
MEEEKYMPADHSVQYCSARIMSPEIVEIGEDSKSVSASRDTVAGDVYVAVGRDDLDVVKWALDHAVSPGARIFLVHVFPPITYINTPVGRLARNQLSQQQVRVYINEENNRRRNLLQKYIRLCTDAKVTVETMLLESNATAKAILDLISILNITSLVMGTKRPHSSRRFGKKQEKGEFVKKNAPEYCEVTIVHGGKKVLDSQQVMEVVPSLSSPSSPGRQEITRPSQRNFFECVCFSGKFN